MNIYVYIVFRKFWQLHPSITLILLLLLWACSNENWIFQKLVQTTVRFRFDGQPISENDTPQGLEMEDGDTIEVFQQQTGGYYHHHLPQLWPFCLHQVSLPELFALKPQPLCPVRKSSQWYFCQEWWSSSKMFPCLLYVCPFSETLTE